VTAGGCENPDDCPHPWKQSSRTWWSGGFRGSGKLAHPELETAPELLEKQRSQGSWTPLARFADLNIIEHLKSTGRLVLQGDPLAEQAHLF
jgi:hypothetical protein